MRIVLNTLRFIFIFYLFFLFLIKAFMFINIRVNENIYPNLNGYTYLKVNSRYQYPEFNMDEHLIIGPADNIRTNDYITYIDNGNIELYNVKSYSGNIVNCVDKDNKEFNIKKSDIKGKLIYRNNEISKVINFLNKPMMVLFMIVYSIFITQIIYDRDKRNFN